MHKFLNATSSIWFVWRLSWQFRKPFNHKTHRLSFKAFFRGWASPELRPCSAKPWWQPLGWTKIVTPQAWAQDLPRRKLQEKHFLTDFHDFPCPEKNRWKIYCFERNLKLFVMRQVFSIVRALLVDPDVLCAFRPLSLVPLDIKPRMGLLLRLWQAGVAFSKLLRDSSTSRITLASGSNKGAWISDTQVKTKEPRLAWCHEILHFGRWPAKDCRHAPLACSDWGSFLMRTRFGFLDSHFFKFRAMLNADFVYFDVLADQKGSRF